MRIRTLIGVIVVALVGATYPTVAYHISGDTSIANPTLTSGDWVVGNGFAIVCESDGNDDPSGPDPVDGAAADDRNDNALGPQEGRGGLCTTGRNDATCALDADAGPLCLGDVDLRSEIDGINVPGPDTDRWTQLDTCGQTVLERGDTPAPPAVNGGVLFVWEPGLDVVDECTGSSDDTSWTAEIGAYSCFIPRAAPDALDQFNDGPVPAGTGGPTTGDMALYYEELYAWWSYDGDGTYGEGNLPATSAGAPGTEDGGTAGVDPDFTINGVPGFKPAPGTGGSDWAAAWHGHVSMFIENTDDADRRGSAETKLWDEDDLPLTHSGGRSDATGTPALMWLGRAPIFPASETRGNNCGASPGGPGEREALATTVDCSDTTGVPPYENDETCGPVLRATSM